MCGNSAIGDTCLNSLNPSFPHKLKRGTIYDTSKLVHKSTLPSFCTIGTNRVYEVTSLPNEFRNPRELFATRTNSYKHQILMLIESKYMQAWDFEGNTPHYL